MGAKGGEKYPVQAYGTFGWDGVQWLKIITSAGGIAVEVRGWGDPPVSLTPRDITLDIQAITDDAIKGIMRSIGDAGAVPLNSAGNTVLQWLFEIEEAIGPTAAGAANAVANNTTRRFLELILAALGGGANETADPVAAVSLAGGGYGLVAVFAGPVENFLMLCEGADAEVEIRKLDGVTWNPATLITQDAFIGVPLAATAIRVRNRGGVAGPVATINATGFRN